MNAMNQALWTVISQDDSGPRITSTSESPPEPLLWTVDEAVEHLRLGRSTIYDLMNKGIIPSVRIGGSRRILVDPVRRWVESLTS